MQEWIRDCHIVVLATHEMPDVDALASCAVFAAVTEALGKRARFLTHSDLGEEFNSLPGIELLRERAVGSIGDMPGDRPRLRPDLLMILDAASLNQLGKAYRDNASVLAGIPVVNIDHHRTNTRFGDINIVEPATSSTCELVLDLVREMGWSFEPWMADALLAGIIVDTSRFSTANVSSRTLRNAAYLIDHGADLIKALSRVSEPTSGARTQAWQTLLSGMEHDANGEVAVLNVSTRTLQEAETTENELKGLANYMRSLQGVKVAVIFVQRSDGTVKVSMRGKPGVDVGSVALKFGGGGHTEAAGCVVEGKSLEKVRSEVLTEIKYLIGQAAETA